MNLANLSIKRPIFITCIVIVMLMVGLISMQKLAIDLFPNITFPIVTVTTAYPGAGPNEVETLVSKVFEDELSTLPGIKTLRSVNKEGVSSVIAEFTLETDVKYAEQQIRDRASSAKRRLPLDIKEPVIRRLDPADQPILIIGLSADLTEAQLYDLADQLIKPKIEQVPQVGLVDISGGRKREIHVEVNRNKLKEHEVSATQVSNRIAIAGQNIPAGKISDKSKETVFRTLGEFRSLKQIESIVVNFLGNDIPVRVRDIAHVTDSLEDEKSRTFIDGKKALTLMVFRQSGANTIAVVDAVKERVKKINKDLETQQGKPALSVIRDGSKMIRANVDDVEESIIIGIILTIVVVFFFLGSARSTLITGLALPNSLIGAFILMALAGFTVNVMTLLALSLAVGLLVDDAIVVRENIFRHMEMGKPPVQAAVEGTNEVMLAVIATTFTIIAVFGPIGFLQGVVGQFFKEFGLTMCFAMLISLFDALTMAPMLSAYLVSGGHEKIGESDSVLWNKTIGAALKAFDKFQTFLENLYERVLKVTLKRPMVILVGSLGIFILSLVVVKRIPATFIPAQDIGEFQVVLDMPPGTSLDKMHQVTSEVESVLRKNKEIKKTIMIVGGRDAEANTAQIIIEMIPSKERKITTTQFKDIVRSQLKPFAYAIPTVQDINMIGNGQRPFNLNIIGTDMDELVTTANQVFEKIRNHPALKDVDISHRPGKPEFQVNLDNSKAERLGVSTTLVGQELRTQIEGSIPAVFREGDREYDIRVRVQEEQRNLETEYSKIFVPNINNTMIRLQDVANPKATSGPANITRQDRGRYIQIAADIAANGPGMGKAMKDIEDLFKSELKLPSGVRYQFVGQAENFRELGQNMLKAVILGILFIFLVLASLYESFVVPLTIMLVLPLAACGAFYALFITGKSLDIFTMIGCIMLLGLATKNSILLVDYANQLVAEGKDKATAIILSGKTRLRPILMTTLALIAGMLPIAFGLNEASRQRTGMGVAVIGGLISSTLLTLVVVPAAYSYVERFRVWSGIKMKNLIGGKKKKTSGSHGPSHEMKAKTVDGTAEAQTN
ncbi:MAG: efflux RND transporter permease subunit [Bacteriovoracia bacterium]